MANEKILVVDDEAAIREMIVTSLEMADFKCLEANNAITAHGIIVDQHPDLILLDWMMPGTSGLELARRLKRDEMTAELPIIMLTAKSEEDNKIQGFDSGADDYISKPFSTRELVARIRAVLRRVASTSDKLLSLEGLSLDPLSQRITANSQTVTMGPTEFKLLTFFMGHQERVYSREQLLDQVWGANVYIEDRTVDVHIRRLRKALEPWGYDCFVQTVRGSGYRFSGNKA